MEMWVLIILVHVGPLGETDSNSLTNVPGFSTKKECEDAGRIATSLVKRTTKELKYVCVKQTKL